MTHCLRIPRMRSGRGRNDQSPVAWMGGLIAAAGLLAGAPPASASFITVGTIDPAGDSNDVDQSAAYVSSTGAGSAANVVNLGVFRTAVAAAFAENRGGVIDFEVRNDAGGTPIGSLDAATILSGRYGIGASQVSGAKSLQLTSGSGTWNWPAATSNGRVPTSGANALAKSGDDVFQFQIQPGAISNGEAGERVAAFGFTVLERSGADVGSPLTATVTFSDGSTASAQATLSGALPAGDEDSFFGFFAPAGLSISSVTFNPGNFTSVDDVAFITTTSDAAVPEPASAAAPLAACALLLRRRRGG